MEKQHIADFSDREFWDEMKIRLLANKMVEEISVEMFSTDRLIRELSDRGYRVAKSASEDELRQAVVSRCPLRTQKAIRSLVYDVTDAYIKIAVL